MASLLYTYSLAFQPAKAALALEEKGIKYKPVHVNLMSGQSLRPPFMKINPLSTVPVLVTADKVSLNQTIDILKYVDSQGEPLGGKDVDRAVADELVMTLHSWDGNLFAAANMPPSAKGILNQLGAYRTKVAEAELKRAEAAGDAMLAASYNAKIAEMAATAAKSRDPGQVEANLKQLEQLLDRAEVQLQSNKFLAGPAYSMPDVVLTVILFRLGTVGQTKQWLQPRPKLSGYYEQVKSRPSFSKVFGPASSSLNQALMILPCVLKAKLAALTGMY